ncbi:MULTISPECIES: site-specific integrase [Alcanivorax]|mgnify:CR=1 FL=1|jgi:integrase|uniref:Phage integrase family protein n=1 Tax=Alcanivorax hongdengensis A-11-3 TaxID=1177179 RepID=L0W9C1_9GAMM|nr:MULTISPECIES: site-specific integrase [Alcanivorax]EKF73541.1 phage integrase family protein [Alcanivorax hongdengensis A-11-3]MDF1637793.1 tyrosine-type recombinase/integrase [Alcanivorax jadensis]|tara:strand:- start:84 stop:1472 length:1389 start_codon:yes stop_codon:yes gene_type:complete
MSKILTDKQLAIKVEKVAWITEASPRGHGRLSVRLRPTGGPLFYFRYSDEDGKRQYIPLGAYSRTGTNGLTLKTARAKANELSQLYLTGIKNLTEHLDAERDAEKAIREAEVRRLEQEAAQKAAEAAALASRQTVSQLFERWMEIDVSHRKDKGAEVRRMFEKDVLPLIGQVFVADIRKGHITQVTDAMAARGVTRMVKVVFSLMRQMFRFAVDRDIIEFDPTSSIRKAKIGGKETERDRVLSEDEILQLKQAIPNANLLFSTQYAIWIALSTCCRIGELLAARWEHLDFDKDTWLIPRENSKNGKPHNIHLSPFSKHYFLKLREIHGNTPWCYPNREGTGALCSKTVTKQLSDRQRPSSQGTMSNRSSKAQSLILPGGKWTPHDLRRTGATMMTALGVIPEVAERCLNHTEENRIKRTYQRHSYTSECIDAWRRLGEKLEEITNQPTSEEADSQSCSLQMP